MVNLESDRKRMRRRIPVFPALRIQAIIPIRSENGR